MERIDSFAHRNIAGRIDFGRGAVADLHETLADLDAERTLIVCGEHVGANRETMNPIESGLGDRLAGVFEGTTPAKTAESAFSGVAAIEEADADALVAVGGGSSIDIARAMRAIHAGGRSWGAIREAAIEAGALPVPDGELVSLVAVPTTLAGADLSTGGSVNFAAADGESGFTAGFGDSRLMPETLVYDPSLFEATPEGVLCGSVMNGFDKGLEALYARDANPVSDALAIRGLELLAPSLPELRAEERDPVVMESVVAGIVLVQYARAAPETRLLSAVHAFGHGLRGGCGIQQGVAHAVMVPHVLDALFEAGDARRDLLADALDVGNGDPATGVVDRVASIRDSLSLPGRLREVDGVEREALPEVAELVFEDSVLTNGPDEYDPTVAEIESTLEAAW